MAEIAIAIDGPASSGKGTVARAVAHALDYAYVDTGAMYRAVGLGCLRRGVDPRDGPGASAVAESLTFRFTWVGDLFRVAIDGEDVTGEIRTGPMGDAASAVSVHAGVRAALLETQRALGRGGGVVMDGRDIGTVVLPDAVLKIFLDASLDERARRRAAERADSDFAGVRAELAARDAQDSGRAAAPLRRAVDAVVVDTTGRSIDAVVAEVLALAGERRALHL